MPNALPHTFIGWMTHIQQHMETVLAGYLPHPDHTPQALHRAMRYAALDGGKRVRPLLAFAASEITQASPTAVGAVAAAVEFIHAYSLVHDDLPCMDDDVLRRGKPTCHVAFDEATALLAGDALQTLAFDVLTRDDNTLDAPRQAKLVRELAKASGYAGMAGGQAIDLAAVGQALSVTQLEYMHLMKTGALIRASVLMGAQAGQSLSAAESQQLEHFANRIGLAFQVVDDVLDCEADSATLGKTAGKDAAHDKPTYVSLMGLGEAKTFARQLREEAFAALEGFGLRAARLGELADYIVVRSF